MNNNIIFVGDGIPAFKEYIDESKLLGIEFLRIDINKSYYIKVDKIFMSCQA